MVAIVVAVTGCDLDGTSGPVTVATNVDEVRVLDVNETQEVLRSRGLSMKPYRAPANIVLLSNWDTNVSEDPPPDGHVLCSVERSLIPVAKSAVVVFGPPVNNQNKVDVTAGNVSCTVYLDGDHQDEQKARLVAAMTAVFERASD